MGVVVNAVTDFGASLEKAGAGVGQGTQYPLGMVRKVGGMDKFGQNAVLASFYGGSRACPVVSEFRDVAEGIA